MNNEIKIIMGGIQWDDPKRSISMQFQFNSLLATTQKNNSILLYKSISAPLMNSGMAEIDERTGSECGQELLQKMTR